MNIYTINGQKKEVKHDIGRTLYGGQGENKIGGAHLRHVGSAMHACKLVENA